MKGLTVGIEKFRLFLYSTARELAGQHVASNSERPTLPVDIYIVTQIDCYPVTQVFEFSDKVQRDTTSVAIGTVG